MGAGESDIVNGIVESRWEGSFNQIDIVDRMFYSKESTDVKIPKDGLDL